MRQARQAMLAAPMRDHQMESARRSYLTLEGRFLDGVVIAVFDVMFAVSRASGPRPGPKSLVAWRNRAVTRHPPTPPGEREKARTRD